MSTNKFSKFVIDNIVVGTPISSIIAAGATIGLDSAAVTALIDSDYVQQRETSGLDSAEVVALIDSDYVSARTPATNGGGLDSAAALDLFAYSIEEVGANQRQVAISLNTFVDPFDQTVNTDRAFNLNYTSTTGMFIRETGGRTEIHADASGTGQSTGLLLTGASFGNTGTEIIGNVKLSSLPTTDPAETGLLWNDGGIPVFSGSTAPTGGAGLDSAAVEGIVDSAYVQSRVTLDGVGLDSAGVTALVDSDYVAARAPAAGETYSIDETGRDNSGDWIQFTAGVGNNQDRVFFKSRDTGNTYRGTNAGFQFDGLTPNQAFVMEDGTNGVKFIGRHAETGGEEGLEIHGVGATVTNSTIRMITNNKTSVKVTDGSFELPSIPTADPANTDEVWADNGVLVMSGFTAPTGGGGGLDSAGVQSVFDNQQSIRLGEGATTQDASGEVAIGYLADATGADAIAIGYDANATALFTLSLGRGSNATFEDAIAIGRSATSSQADTIAMGTSSVASGSRSVAIGNGTDATGGSSVALGNSAQALATNAIAIGQSADTNLNADGIAIGSNTEVKGAQGISIGQTAEASQASVAIGSNASVTTGTESTAIGPFAGATGNASLALGRGAKANANNTIALAATGATSTVATQFGIDIRTSAAGSLTYDTTNDWTFGAGVTMTDLTSSGVVIFSALPTTDPVNAGQLWNDGGTLKVSAG